MKLEEFVSFPARISDDFIGVPTISEVFGHYIVIQRELSSRSVKWSKEDVYNQVAEDLISLFEARGQETISSCGIVK